MTALNISAQKPLREPNRQMRVQVLDNKDEVIPYAKLSFNGYEATYDSIRKDYVLRFVMAREYHVQIEHPNYINVDVKKINGTHRKFYLFKEGQPYVFRSGLNYPIIDYSHLLFVTLPRADENRSNEQIWKEFTTNCDQLNLEVYQELDRYDKNVELDHGTEMEFLRRSYILRSSAHDTSQFDMNSSIENLRYTAEFIGPVLSNTEDLSDATFVSNQVAVQLRLECDVSTIVKEIEALGAKKMHEPYEFFGAIRIDFTCNDQTLIGTNEFLEKVHQMEGVKQVILSGYPTFHEMH